MLNIPEYITIKTSNGAVAAYLSPKSDGLKDCEIDHELNGKSTLTLSLPTSSDKWQYLTDQYRIYAGGREFVILNPDAVEKVRDGKKLWGKITAHESWVLLGKKYATVSNDPQTPNPPWSAVVILSGGSDLSGGRYPVGSAGHALYAILQGTGWSVGTVDVEGTHDLETEKLSVLENINKIQEIWGGYLVWDSVNKTVSLRSETAWAPYTGYQVRYAKNLKNITRTSDYDIITRLYPFGENDLNIASVNDGKIYLENFSYTSEVLEGIWVNQDIADPAELKAEAEKYLAKVCRPRHNYRISQVDLRLLPGYQHEDFDLGHLVDVIDEELGVNTKARIIRYRYNVFQPWQCEFEVGDPIEKLESMLVDSREMVQYLNSIKTSKGQITAYKLVDESIIAQKIAKAAVDATRLNTKTVILLDDVWTDNSPSSGYVSWNQHKLYYAGREYVITAGNTNLKYIYWDGSSSSYSTSATEPNLTDGQFIIAVNNGGLHDIVWNKGYGREFIGSAFIADAAIKSAHIDEAQILDAHIANVSANKITTGQLLAYLVEILGQNGYFKITGDGLRVYDDVGNLKGHMGWYETLGDQTATFSRSTVAYNDDGTQVAANTPRYKAGKYGDGAWMEEGTTNPLTENQSSVETDTTGLAATANATISRDTVEKWHGVASLKVVTAGGAVAEGFYTNPISVTASATYTASVWLKGSGTVILRLREINSAGATIGETLSGVITLTSQWARYSVTRKFSANGVQASIHVRTDVTQAITFYADGLQIEQKPYATSWTLGGSTRAADNLSYTLPKPLPVRNAGCLWWKPSYGSTPTKQRTLYYVFNTAATPAPRYSVQYDISAGVFTFQKNDGTTWYNLNTNAISFAAGDTIFVAWLDDPVAGYMKLWVGINGGALSEYTLANTVQITDAQKVYIGCYKSAGYECDGVIDDPQLYDVEQMVADGIIFDINYVNNIYTSTVSPPVNEYTICKFSLDGHLKPTVRRFGLWAKNGEISLVAPPVEGGIRVYDASGNLRTHIGQYAAGKYGAKVINGEIYSSIIRTGLESDNTYVAIEAPNKFVVYYGGQKVLETLANSNQGHFRFFEGGVQRGTIYAGGQSNPTFYIVAEESPGVYRRLYLQGDLVEIFGNGINIEPGTGYVDILGDCDVDGTFTAGNKLCIEETSQGFVGLQVIESPEVLYVDRKGVAELVNGECRVDIDPLFLECICPNTEETPWNIILTPKGPFTLYEAEIGDSYFVVKSHDPSVSGKFSWVLFAVRKGKAGVRFPNMDYLKSKTKKAESTDSASVVETIEEEGIESNSTSETATEEPQSLSAE